LLNKAVPPRRQLPPVQLRLRLKKKLRLVPPR
jgi:hypothetical protein